MDAFDETAAGAVFTRDRHGESIFRRQRFPFLNCGYDDLIAQPRIEKLTERKDHFPVALIQDPNKHSRFPLAFVFHAGFAKDIPQQNCAKGRLSHAFPILRSRTLSGITGTLDKRERHCLHIFHG